MDHGDTQEQEVYSNLIGLIYDAAQHPALWPELLDELQQFLGEGHDQENLEPLRQQSKKKLLEPHFERAIKLNKHLHNLEIKSQTTENILNQLPIAILVVDTDAKPVALNKRAQKLLDFSQTFRINSGKVSSHSRLITEKLHASIRNCTDGKTTENGTPLHISNDHGDHTSVWVTSSSQNSLYDPGHACLFISSPLIRDEYNIDALQKNFDLTNAEARLLKVLTNGCHNLNDAAKSLGLSIHTVRTQIKGIFSKTNTTNQMELIKKVLTEPSVIIDKQLQPAEQRLNVDQRKQVPFNVSSIKLFDGRRLAYAEYGAPDGAPVFMFHAIAGSRLQYPAEETRAKELGLRIIVPDRPGHGYSDHKDQRQLLEWPEDILQLAKHLNFENFSILSFASGCCYALACAYKMPSLLNNVCLVTARGPVDSFSDTLSMDGLILRMARHAPGLLSKYMRVMVSDVGKNPIEALEKRYRYLSKSDKQSISSNPVQKKMYEKALLEAIRQGHHGIVQDLITVMQPHEFTHKEIEIPIRLWHGLEDKSFPVRAARKLASELPNCEATLVPQIGSMLIIEKWEEILDDFAASIRGKTQNA